MKFHTKLSAGFLIASVVLVGFAFGTLKSSKTVEPTVQGAWPSNPSFYVASSSVYTVTTSSVQVLASSTQTKRLAVTLQNINCTQSVFLRLANDAPATANSGMVLAASSTLSLTDYNTAPFVVQGAIRAITPSGSCTVLVNEWKSQY